MPTGHLHQLIRFAPAQQDHVPALRIAATVAVPLVALLQLGRMDLAIFASFGTFPALYARQEPPLARLRRQSQAGAMFLACIAVGMVLNHLHASPWTVVVVCAVVAGLGAVGSALLTLRPPGSVFMIFSCGAVGSLPHPVSWADGMGTAALAVLWSVLAGALGVLLGEGRRGHVAPVPEHHGMTGMGILRYGATFFGACLVAGLLGQASGVSHPYWAMVAAAAAITGPNSRARLYRAIQRIVGTFGGVFITAFVLSQGLQAWHLVVYVALFQFLAEAYVMRNYGFATFFITPLALLMLQLGHPSSPTEILTARMAETAIGGAVVFVFVLLWRTREEKSADTQALPILRGPHSTHREGPSA